MATEQFLFLDIDGPMIPSGCFLAFGINASFERRFSPIAVACVNYLCEKSGAKIVFNTTHNRDGIELISDSQREGIRREYIYLDNPMTEYPDLDRATAINHWLVENEKTGCEWVAFDDQNFAHENLILIEFDVGVTPGAVNEAMGVLGCKDTLIIL